MAIVLCALAVVAIILLGVIYYRKRLDGEEVLSNGFFDSWDSTFRESLDSLLNNDRLEKQTREIEIHGRERKQHLNMQQGSGEPDIDAGRGLQAGGEDAGEKNEGKQCCSRCFR